MADSFRVHSLAEIVSYSKRRGDNMLIIDGHEDIAYNALAWGRDIRLSVYTIREREAQRSAANEGTLWANPGGIAMSGLPELRRGGVGIVFGVIFTYPFRNARERLPQSYRTAEE